MRKLPNHTALKEWSSVIEALGRGEQVVLVRKGGLADPEFGLEAKAFYLYPTYFHQGETEARPSVTVTHWAEAVRTWRVSDVEQLGRMETLVTIPRETLETRYRFRPDQALHVIGVRVWQLERPVEVKFQEKYAGCLSWVSVDEEIDVTGSVQVLREDELEERLSAAES
ncbi:MAG TPA: DUF1802 family protein [Thermoanaerobaculia bacterium]|nr:DUF1802 family protein [Thermoanaerobaculia bacterium]